MPRIKAVCLSDLHLGSESSVLTEVNPETHGPDTGRTSPVLGALVECLKTVLREHDGPDSPTLVLAGDTVETALSTVNVAGTVFGQFTTLLFDPSEELLSHRVIHVPGNHDHHLWETARERQYAAYLPEVRDCKELTQIPWHATHLFQWKEGVGRNREVSGHLLTTLIQRTDALADASVVTFYPNLGFLAENGRCTVTRPLR
jgi:metallophosphoesterase superfamily enzyme